CQHARRLAGRASTALDGPTPDVADFTKANPCRAAAPAAPVLHAQQHPMRLLLTQQAIQRLSHPASRAMPAPRA
ncbi:hypothetical protein, partial [Escherichia coli]|uniref:hypothetical protein n=1 Tax=Escherichia coli TaxID=562 RepID=UPI0019D53483